MMAHARIDSPVRLIGGRSFDFSRHIATMAIVDFAGEALDRGLGDRVAGSLSAAVFCATQGARIVRTHNVQETVDAMRMVEAILGWREPAHLTHNMPQEGDA